MKQDISVGLIGFGGVGKEIFFKLADMPEIQKIYLSSRSGFDTNSKKNKKIWAKQEVLSKKDISIVDYDHLEDMLNTDIQIVVIDANKTKSPIREENLPKNIEAFNYIAGFQKGYQGTTLIVSNPVDELCYVYASLSGADPRKVVGLNELDRMRAVSLLKDYLSTISEKEIDLDDLEVFTIGPHSQYVLPILKSINKISPNSFRSINSEFLKIWRDQVTKYGPSQMRLGGSTAPSTAEATKNVLKAIIDETSIVCCSAYSGLRSEDPTLEERLNLFIGLPVVFNEGKAQARLDLINFDDFKWKDFLEGYSSIEKNLIPRIKNSEFKELIKSDTVISRGYFTPGIIIKDTKFDPDIRIFASAGKNLYSCNPNKPNQPEVIYEADSSIGSVKYIKEKNIFLIGQRGKLIKFSSDTEKKEEYLLGDDTTIRSIESYHTNKDNILIGSTNTTGIYVWDERNHKVISRPITQGIKNLAVYDFDDQKIIYAIGNELIYVDLTSNKTKCIMDCLSGGDIKISHDKIYAATGLNLYQLLRNSETSEIDIKETNIPTDYLRQVATRLFVLERPNEIISFLASENYNCVARIDTDIDSYERSSRNGIASLLAFDNFLVAGDKKTNHVEPQISIWHLGNTKKEYEILTGFGNRSITSLNYRRD